jgi:hypothetical protein
MDKKNKDRIITASIIIAASYLLYKIFSQKKIGNTNTEGGGIVLPNPGLGGTIGAAPTLPEAKLKDIANKLYEAMDGYGTNNEAIKNQIALLKNNDDFMGLVAAYGIKELSSGKYNPIPNFIGNLPEAIANELSQSQISELNSILIKNSINIRFNDNGQLTTI